MNSTVEIPKDVLIKEAFPPPMQPVYGVFDLYSFEEDEHYGMFLMVNDSPVFVEIREDKFIEERQKFAKEILSNIDDLSERLISFVNAEKKSGGIEFKSVRIKHIGLFDKKNPNFGEVTLIVDSKDSNWMCSLSGLDFSNLEYFD